MKILREVEKLKPELLNVISNREYTLIISRLGVWRKMGKVGINHLRDSWNSRKITESNLGLNYGLNHKPLIKQLDEQVIKPLEKAEAKITDKKSKAKVKSIIKHINKLKEWLGMVGWFAQERYWPGFKQISKGIFTVDSKICNPQKEPTKTAIKRMMHFYAKIKYAI